jgi:hypothetical protein
VNPNDGELGGRVSEPDGDARPADEGYDASYEQWETGSANETGVA